MIVSTGTVAGLLSNGSIYFRDQTPPNIDIECMDESDRIANLQPETVVVQQHPMQQHGGGDHGRCGQTKIEAMLGVAVKFNNQSAAGDGSKNFVQGGGLTGAAALNTIGADPQHEFYNEIDQIQMEADKAEVAKQFASAGGAGAPGLCQTNGIDDDIEMAAEPRAQVRHNLREILARLQIYLLV